MAILSTVVDLSGTRFKRFGDSRDLEEVECQGMIRPQCSRSMVIIADPIIQMVTLAWPCSPFSSNFENWMTWSGGYQGLGRLSLPERTIYLRNLGVCLRACFTHLEDLDQVPYTTRQRGAFLVDNLNRWNYCTNVGATVARF